MGSRKLPWLVEELGLAEVARQQAIRALFDPHRVMNPGRGLPR